MPSLQTTVTETQTIHPTLSGGLMKEQFMELSDLFGYYQFLKMYLQSEKTLLPKKDQNFDKYNVMLAKSIREEQLCFVGDIEKFVYQYYHSQKAYVPIPLDCLKLIFEIGFCQYLTPYGSLGQLAKRFRYRIKKGEKLPRRLIYPNHLSDIVSDMKEAAKIYFENKNFLIPEENTTML